MWPLVISGALPENLFKARTRSRESGKKVTVSPSGSGPRRGLLGLWIEYCPLINVYRGVLGRLIRFLLSYLHQERKPSLHSTFGFRDRLAGVLPNATEENFRTPDLVPEKQPLDEIRLSL